MAQSYQVDIVTKVVGASKVAQLEKSLNKLNQNSTKVSKAASQMSGSLQRASSNLSQAGGSARRASAGVKAFGAATVGATGTLKAFGAAMASYLAPVAAIAAAVGALAKSFQIAGEREADARALANGLQKIGAEKGALDSLQASADKLGKTTLFNQEDFTKGYKLLTSFRNIGLSSYEEVSTAAADMATVIGGDVNSSLLQLAKALENPSVGLSYLSRSGTTFTDSQKEMIKKLQESGNLLGAQAEIMKVVQAQYGGAAEAAGKSGLAGAFDSMMETLRDAGEVIGKALEPLAVGAMNAITQAVQGMGAVWKQLQTQVFPGLKNAIDPVYQAMKEIVEKINWEAVAKVVGGVLVGAFKALEFALKPVLWLIEQMLKGLKALIDSPVGKVLGDIFNKVADALGGANKEAESLKENTEAAVKPVEDLKQNIEQTQEPLKASVGSAEELKTNMDGAATATGNAKAQADGLAGSLANAAQQSQAVKPPMEKAAQATKGMAGAAVEVGKGLAGAVPQAKALQHASHAAHLNNLRAAEYQKKHQKSLAFEAELQDQINEKMMKIIDNKLSLHDLDEATRKELEYQLALMKDSSVQLGKNAAASESGRDTQREVGALLDANNSKIEAMAAGLWKGADAAGAMADNLARAGNAAGAAGGGGGGGGRGGGGTGIQSRPNGTTTTTRDGQTFIGIEGFDLQYQMRGYTGGIPRDENVKVYNHPRFGHISYPELQYLIENPTHGLHHYKAAKEAEREEQERIQYEIQHGPDTYQQRNSGRSSSSSLGLNPNVNVNYTGSTVNFNGDDYIKKSDVNGIVKSATNATMTTLRHSSGSRLSAGL